MKEEQEDSGIGVATRKDGQTDPICLETRHFLDSINSHRSFLQCFTHSHTVTITVTSAHKSVISCSCSAADSLALAPLTPVAGVVRDRLVTDKTKNVFTNMHIQQLRQKNLRIWVKQTHKHTHTKHTFSPNTLAKHTCVWRRLLVPYTVPAIETIIWVPFSLQILKSGQVATPQGLLPIWLYLCLFVCV